MGKDNLWFKNAFDIETKEDLKQLCDESGVNLNPHGDGLILLDYNQITSKGSNYFARFCRGLILDELSLGVVARPFNRFFNYGEQFTDLLLNHAIDNNRKVEVYDKLDGSILKLFYNPHKEKWVIGTRAGSGQNLMMHGNISYQNAFVAAVKNLCSNATEREYIQFVNNSESQKDYFDELLQDFCHNEQLAKNITYIFEICTPYNKVVINYDGFNAHFLSALDTELPNTVKQFDLEGIYANGNKEEILKAQILNLENELMTGMAAIDVKFKSEHVKFPEKIPVTDDLLLKVQELDGAKKEGYVVYIDGIPKVKIKSPNYLALHRSLSSEFTPSNASDVVWTFEEDEYLAIMPERKEKLQPYIDARNYLLKQGAKVLEEMKEKFDLSEDWQNDKEKRKNIYMTMKDTCEKHNIPYMNGFIMQLMKGSSLAETINNMSSKTRLSLIMSKFNDEDKIKQKPPTKRKPF